MFTFTTSKSRLNDLIKFARMRGYEDYYNTTTYMTPHPPTASMVVHRRTRVEVRMVDLMMMRHDVSAHWTWTRPIEWRVLTMGVNNVHGNHN